MSREREQKQTTGSNKRTPPLVIAERASLGMAESIMSNYRDSMQALMELVDNAVDNRIGPGSKETGFQLEVRITLRPDGIAVFNRGGKGLDFAGLQDFFFWGRSNLGTSWRIGQYGVGGKAAMGFLGHNLAVRCSPQGSNTEYSVEIRDWDSKSEVGEVQHKVEERTAIAPDGYFIVQIDNLKGKKINGQDLVTRLSSVYRPLLQNGEVKFVIIKPNHQKEEIKPLEIKYLESDPNFKPQTTKLETGYGDIVTITVGALEEGQKVTPGLRLYYRGRLISEGEFFKFPKEKQIPQASRLIGEVFLDTLPVTVNKSDFIRSSEKWVEAERVINEVLRIWAEKLQNLKIENRHEVQEYEKQIVEEAKRALEDVLAHTGLITKKIMPGESSGRLPGTDKGGHRNPPTGASGSSREGATAPDIRATVGPKVPRWGALSRWDVIPMGNPDIMSQIIELDGGKKALVINNEFAAYQAAKKAGRDALHLYVGETAILEICHLLKREESVDVFIKFYQELRRQLGEYNEQALHAPRKGRLGRGTIKFDK